MNTDELTQIATAHQSVLTRHEQQFAVINATLDRIALSQERISQQQALNTEGMAELRARLLELRYIVSDYIQGRDRQAPSPESSQ